MRPFEYMLPYSMEEALSLLDPEDPGIRAVSGGTAIMLMMKASVLAPTRLVSLHHLSREHGQIAVDPAGNLVIGAMTRLAAIEHDSRVREGWPLLARTMRTLANVRVRAVATVGGALAHADPHMDLPPVLAALGARVTISGSNRSRTVAADRLATGYYETVVGRDELITEVLVPPQAGEGVYEKVTTRAAHDWPALALAVVLQGRGAALRGASIVLGAATDKPTRLSQAEQSLEGSAFDEAAVRRACECAVSEAEVAGDQHGSADYKRHLLSVNLGRALNRALGRPAIARSHS